MITKSKERNMGMDVARVIATIYIIGYLHLKSYQGAEYIMPHFFGEAFVTKIMLGLFMFISGFFMASYSFENFKEDSIAFYTKRFFRFYPLFALAACTLFLIGYNPNPLKLVMTLTGTSTFIAQPGTLWFMVLLMMFYFFTPLIMKDGTVESILIRSLFLFAIVLFISDLIGIIVLGGVILTLGFLYISPRMSLVLLQEKVRI